MEGSSELVAHRHYSPTHRVIAWVSQNLFSDVTYTVRHGLLTGLRRRGGLGWVPALLSRGTNTEEHRFFASLDLRGKTVYDVGAFVGLFAMHCARSAMHVVCYEPMEDTRRRLQTNLDLNNFANVQIRPFGLGAEPATLEMAFDPLMPGGASVDAGIAGGIVAGVAASERRTIRITTLDQDAADAALPPPQLIKIDTEGFELQALRGGTNLLRTHRPDLYLEMHGETKAEKLDKVRGIVEFVTELGYSKILHIETGKSITQANAHDAAEGHLFCQY
jgi:FkbM family methyltransferase